jgi:predicted transcriptional regulator
METVKQQAKEVIDKLPEQASWDDVMYEIYVRAKVEVGLEDIKMGRVLEHDEVIRRLEASSK